MIGFIIWIVIGGVLGWLASIVMRTDGQQGIFLNIVVGIVGSMLGAMVLGRFFGAPGINNGNPFDMMNMLVAFLGAVILLAIVNLVTRGRVR